MSYRQSLALNQDLDVVWCELGKAYSKREAHDKARENVRKAISLKPEQASYWAALSDVVLWQALRTYKTSDEGKFAIMEAETDARTAIRLDSGCSDCWVSLGNSLMARERCEDAESAYQKAIELSPRNVGAWTGLASLQAYQGKKKELEETLTKLKQINPKAADVIRGLLPQSK